MSIGQRFPESSNELPSYLGRVMGMRVVCRHDLAARVLDDANGFSIVSIASG